jgi:hypothetical protein
MPRPPASVVLVARTHWLVGATVVASAAFFRTITMRAPIEFSRETYVMTAAFAVAYLLGGTLVWFGLPPGRLLSRVCALPYLARPRFGLHLWHVMDSAEYQAHFRRAGPGNGPASGKTTP